MPKKSRKIYDKGPVTTGLIIFVLIMTFPFWYNMGKAATAPERVLSDKAKAAKECVAPTPFMKAEHMQILNLWRNSVVRDANRLYTAPDGKSYNMSLSTGENSCMGCHVSKAEFCDRCHNYASVKPYCWDCHIEPKENN